MEENVLLQLKDVEIRREENVILKDASLTLHNGEFIYIIGKVGSGKSSLLKSLYSEIPIQNGEAHLMDFDLRKLQRREIPQLRRKLGIVFQDFQLLNDRSVNDNLIFVMKATGWKDEDAMRHRMNEVLDKVGLITKGFKMPHQLSGGEQQRVSIARALINDPEIILADEPTGNLEPETSEGIMQLLFDIRRTGRAVFMATHNYNMIDKFPSRTVRCEGGRVHDSMNHAI